MTSVAFEDELKYTYDSLSDDVLRDREDGRRYFHHFVKGAWQVLEPATPFVDSWHIQASCDHLQAISSGGIQRLIANVPPGTMKSLLYSVMWPVWDWIEHPWRRFLTGSYGMNLSSRDSLKSRRLIQSNWFQARWGEAFVLTGDKNTITHYENSKTGYRLATSVGGATGQRANVRILDDPHNIEGESDDVREGTITWARTVWSERGANPKTDIQIVVMQRIHERDICGYLLDELGGFEHLMLPMRYEPSRSCVTCLPFRDPRTHEGELLCPARWDNDEVTAKETRLGEYQASAQLQQRPSPPEGGVLKRHWWRYWHHPGQPLPPVPVKVGDKTLMIEPEALPWTFDQEAQSFDMNFKVTQTSDYVAGGDAGKQGPKTYIRDAIRGKWSFVRTLDELRSFMRNHPTSRAKLIEETANGAAIISTLETEIPGIIPVTPKGGKESRAQAGAPFVKAGNVLLPHPQLADWVDGFIEECATFPNGTHDDQVDWWSQLMAYLYDHDREGIPITPEYDPRFHLSQQPMKPVPGLESYRFWHVDYWTCCLLVQKMPKGAIVLFDCLLEENMGLDQFIDWKVQPLLNERYRGVWNWRDVWNRKMPTATDPESEHTLINQVGEKLKGSVEPGEPKFETRVEAIKSILQQVNRFIVNVECTDVHDALKGRFAYPTDASGIPRKSESIKNHRSSAVGEALGHGLAKVFTRKPAPPPRSNGKPPQQRAKSYAVQ